MNVRTIKRGGEVYVSTSDLAKYLAAEVASSEPTDDVRRALIRFCEMLAAALRKL